MVPETVSTSPPSPGRPPPWTGRCFETVNALLRQVHRRAGFTYSTRRSPTPTFSLYQKWAHLLVRALISRR